MCGDVCPQGCIKFIEDEEGFFYPQIDEISCVDCGLCAKRCPAINFSYNKRVNDAIAGYAKEKSVKETGSSGGVFFLLASYIIKSGGVVYGAAFDEKFILKHYRVDEVKNILSLCKSKYIQSDCEKIYLKVKEDLDAEKNVIFVGTPCQCQALKNFIGKSKCDKLILVDFICHGVSCQKLFNENLEWNKKKFGKIKSIEFRHKGEKVKHPHTLRLVYEKKGKEKSLLRLHYQDPYYFGFQKHITLRPSCYSCSWAKPERCSDITLADFWGIEKANIGLDSKKGVSCILLNSEKGKIVFSSIKDMLEGVNEISIDFAMNNNHCLTQATSQPIERDSFFIDWKKYGYDVVASKYMKPKRKWIYDLYYAIPTPVRKFVRKLMENRMKYE